MITTYSNHSIKELHTFGIQVLAEKLISFTDEKELPVILDNLQKGQPLLILGGGSNILFTKDFNGTILSPQLRGIEIVNNSRDHVLVRVACAEPWDDFVKWAVENGWGGVENLSLIPGNTGSSPIQNIGAYGIEAGEVIHSLEYIDLLDRQKKIIEGADCEFGYRTSIFKTHLKGQIIITHVCFLLSKDPVLRTHYGGLSDELKKYDGSSIKTVREAVCAIRRRKLPDPAVTGNAGSFFKNPVIDKVLAEKLLSQFPVMPHFETEGMKMKIPAGWLIEKCGWKGFRKGDAGVHPEQALVLVNYGTATGAEILDLATQIRASVSNRFGIELEMEVNVV